MADKKLTIAVEAKVSPSVQNLNKMLDDFASRGNKVARAFQQVSGVGSDGQKDVKAGGLAKALLQEKKLFDDLGKSGEKLAKVLNDQVSKSQTSLAKQLETSTKNLEQLVKKHESAQARVNRLKQGGAPSNIVSMFEGSAVETGQQVLAGAAQQSQARAALDAFKSPSNSAIMADIVKSAVAVAAPLMLGAGVMAAGQRVAQGVIDWNMSGHQQAAAIGGTISQMSGGTTNLAQAFALAQAIGDPDRSMNKAAAMTGSFAGSFLQQAKVWNAVLDPGNYFAGFRNDVVEGRMTQAAISVDSERAQQEMLRRPMFADVMNAKQAAAGRQVAAMRSLGLSGAAGGALQQMYNTYGGGDWSAGLSPAETEAFLSSVGSQAGVGSLSQMLGTEHRGKRANAAMMGGLNRDIVAALSAAGILGGGDLVDRGVNLDLTTQSALGRMVSAAVLNPMSALTGGEGLQGMLQTGLAGQSPAMQLRMLQQNSAGAGAMGKIGQGNDAYQQSKNLVNAIGILGPGANIYAQDALARVMSDPAAVADMMANRRVSPEMAARGLGFGHVQAMADRQFSDVASRYRTAGKSTKGGNTLMQLAGMTREGRRAFLAAHPEAAINAGTAAFDADPSAFANEREAAGWIRADAGLGTKAIQGTRPDVAKGTPELSALNAQMGNLVTRFEKLGGATKEIETALRNAALNINLAWNLQMSSANDNTPVRWKGTAYTPTGPNGNAARGAPAGSAPPPKPFG